MSVTTLAIVAVLYLCVIGFLGFRGYKATKNTSDYLVAGRQIHPFVMALSYGATFISTSAIVGFGGAAAAFGMGLLWLTFLNIFVGIFLAFTIFGKRTRRMGHHLQAHTFPELLGKRFDSRFIQGASGLIILCFMPLYAAAVLISAAKYLGVTFEIDFPVAVTIFSVLIAGYVVAGGLKGVMYTDALQGALMFIGMLILIAYTYSSLGGVTSAHQKLVALPDQIDQQFVEITPELENIKGTDPGAGEKSTFAWYAEKATTLKASKTMTDEEKAKTLAADATLMPVGGLMKKNSFMVSKLVTEKLSKDGWLGWTKMPKRGSNFYYVLITSIIMGVGIGVLAQPQLAVRFMTVKSDKELNHAVLVGGIFILTMTGVAFLVGNLSNVWFVEQGAPVSLAAADGSENVIPEFIKQAMPQWFGAIFMLTLLSAAMSTLSSQFHAMGTAIGRDFFERGLLNTKDHTKTVLITRLGVVATLIATILLALSLPDGIVAAATAIFFGLCAAAFLPAFIGALFWKRMTKAGAIASILVGFLTSFFWLMFIQEVKGKIPAYLCNILLDKPTLLPDKIMGIQWNWVESLFVALPLSALTAIIVSLFTQPMPEEHVARCFHGAKSE